MHTRRPSRWFRLNLWLHRWASLVATVPFLILCLTGTVLIFHEEIDAAMGVVPTAQGMEDAPHRPLAESVDNILKMFPDERVLSIGQEPEEHPGVLLVVTGPKQDHGFQNFKLRFTHLATAQPTEQGVSEDETLTGFLLKLHAQWFLGPPGELIGALIALLVLLSLLSALVVYAPYVKRIAFGILRRGRGPRLLQLDLHNFIGALVMGWAFAVTITGFLLGFGTIATGIWQKTELAALQQRYSGEPVDARRGRRPTSTKCMRRRCVPRRPAGTSPRSSIPTPSFPPTGISPCWSADKAWTSACSGSRWWMPRTPRCAPWCSCRGT